MCEDTASEVVCSDVADGGVGFDNIDGREVEDDFVDGVASVHGDETIAIDAWLSEYLASEVVFVAFADEDVLDEVVVTMDLEVEIIYLGADATVDGVGILAWIGEIAAVEVVVVALADGFLEGDMFFESDEVEVLLMDVDAASGA